MNSRYENGTLKKNQTIFGKKRQRRKEGLLSSENFMGKGTQRRKIRILGAAVRRKERGKQIGGGEKGKRDGSEVIKRKHQKIVFELVWDQRGKNGLGKQRK